jgi:WD40 repeat protein
MEYRAATSFTGGHSDDVDYVSWNPTHPELFCTSSQKDRRIVFWDARRECPFGPSSQHISYISRTESRNTQQIALKVSPVQTNYSPDGRSLLYTSAGHQLFFMTFGKENEATKEQWTLSEKDGVCTFGPSRYISSSLTTDDLAYCGLHGNVQPRRRRCRYDAPSRAHNPCYGLSFSCGT